MDAQANCHVFATSICLVKCLCVRGSLCGSVCVCGSVRLRVLWLPVADGCNFPTSISFPGLAMNKLCELFGQGPGAHPFWGE